MEEELVIQNGNHTAWKQRLQKEEKHALVSLAKGLELGLVNQLPCVTNSGPLDTMLRANKIICPLIQGRASYTSRIEKQQLKNPLSTLQYQLKDHTIYKNVRDLLNTHKVTAYGVFPGRFERRHESVQPRKRLYYDPKPYGIRTYPIKLPYMRANLELAHPEIQHVTLRTKPESSCEFYESQLGYSSRLAELKIQRSNRREHWNEKRQSPAPSKLVHTIELSSTKSHPALNHHLTLHSSINSNRLEHHTALH